MSDINRPATLSEIADLLGVHKSTIERQANKARWKFSEETSKGKHKKRLYALKNLPSEIQEVIQRKRRDDDITRFHEAQQANIATTEQSDAKVGNAIEKRTAQAGNLVVADCDGTKDYSQEQRDTDMAIKTIMRWLDAHPSGKHAKALCELNERYRNNDLPSALMSALSRCKQKTSGNPKTDDILTKSTLDKWKIRFKAQGNYIPNTKGPDTTFKTWHLDLMDMIANNPSKKTITWMIEQLVEKYGDEVSERKVRYWIESKLSNQEIIKGQNSGMALKAMQVFRRRTSAGMMPWDEIHADGWATHFTAPHPRNGDYVTYEVWDFHDVATRYVPPLSVGLSECTEVIAKGIENAIRDQGVMRFLQTDSTKIVKNNAKFTGDPITSIADVMGFTGKSRCVDHFGASRSAIHIEGMPGMTVGYLRDLLAFELSCAGGSKFTQEKSIRDAFAQRAPTVILDEAQHGLDRKAECIEFLRRFCEQAGSVLILVCHTSERHRFGEHKLAHIATRISALVDFKPATLEDTALYLSELCEVSIDGAIAEQAFNESRGRYRLLSSACMSLEALASRAGKTALAAGDVKGLTLCEDAMRSLRKGARA